MDKPPVLQVVLGLSVGLQFALQRYGNGEDMSSQPREQRSILDMDREIQRLQRQEKNYKADNSRLRADVRVLEGRITKLKTIEAWADKVVDCDEIYRMFENDAPMLEAIRKLSEALGDA